MSRIAFEGRQFRVEVDERGGREIEIVRHVDAAAIVAVHEGDVVLVRQYRHPVAAGVLELPAGKVDAGETPLETAQRELEEECGLRGGDWRHLISFWTTPGFCDERMHLFLAESLEPCDPRPEDDEVLDVVRWPLGEVAGRLAEVEDAKTLVGLMLLLHGGAAPGDVSFRRS